MSERKFPVKINTVRISKPRLEVYYPKVSGCESGVAEKRINNKIISLVNQMIKDQGYYDNPKTDITGYYEIKTNERGLLSLTMSNYAFSGGAHGITLLKALTFDVETGYDYELNQLFSPYGNYIKVLSDMIKIQIKQREIPLIVDFQQIRPDQDYYLADKCLVVYFQQYELAPYAYGFPQFPISIYDLQDIIAEQPLGRMLY
ncbi:MAG: DUF3298 and DUF4163 domain-containing protein [Zhaonellaceae bacterium]|jgi:hypothetical protein|nr:DUF3298 and DUF4163 domain-containing protein [Clostridia bacterium]